MRPDLASGAAGGVSFPAVAKVVLSIRVEQVDVKRWRTAAKAAGLSLGDYVSLRVNGEPTPSIEVPPPPVRRGR
jgi:hypothetical protein